MIIKIKELCEVDYIAITDPNTKPVPSIRTTMYNSDKSTLLEAFTDYQNNFNIDKIIDCEDDFEGECLDVVKVLSVEELTTEVYEDITQYLNSIRNRLGKETWYKHKEKANRMLTIAYNAIVLGRLDEQYNKEELLEELGCSEEEYDEIMKI